MDVLLTLPFTIYFLKYAISPLLHEIPAKIAILFPFYASTYPS
jgi:hypothetical protein